MAKKKNNGEVKATDYRHTGEKRTNIPPAKIAAEGKVPVVPKVRYHYSPHLPPVLQFDSTGKADKLPHLLAESGKRPLTPEEQRVLADALRTHQPWLEWAGKSERYSRRFFDVEPVALHIHERVSAQATIRTLTRMDVQRDLFADPQQTYAQAVQFYKHSVDWANRLILGDSLEVMTSLAKREQLAGKVQMIYVDPPYGIRYASNFQPLIGSPRVKDQDADLTREPESVRAYRDTWHLGRHSYLQYLFERLQAAKELLSTSGSIFVQIGDDNVHLVRNLMDEVLGAENFVAVICFRTTGGLGRKGIKTVFDLLIWYARDKGSMKFRPLFRTKVTGEDSMFRYRRTSNGEIRPLDDTDGYTSANRIAL